MISLDLETTGLDPYRHEAWEIGLVRASDGVERLYEFSVQNLRNAEAAALEISGYYDRHTLKPGGRAALRHSTGSVAMIPNPIPAEEAALEIAEFTVGERLMGCAIQFDMTFLTALLRKYGVRPAWHHRALDLGSWAAGRAGAQEPFASRSMADRVPNEEAHTALGDARWNVAVYKHFLEGDHTP